MDFNRDNENFIKMYINEPDFSGKGKRRSKRKWFICYLRCIIITCIIFYYFSDINLCSAILFFILCSVSLIFCVMIIFCLVFHTFYVIQFMYLYLYFVRKSIHRTRTNHHSSYIVSLAFHQINGLSHFITQPVQCIFISINFRI